MFDNLTSLGYGIVTFAIVIGVGAIILLNFGTAVANCNTGFTYNSSSELCTNSTGDTQNPSQGTQNVNYLQTQLGQGGLAGWTPAIIAFTVGMLFLGAFLIKKGRSY